MKKIIYIMTILLLWTLIIPQGNTANAASHKNMTFERVSYSERTNNNGEIVKNLNEVTLIDENGREFESNINNNVRLSINDKQTTIEGFKKGMQVEVDVNFGRVVTMQGTSNEPVDNIVSHKPKTVLGVITNIDPNGMFVIVKPNTGDERTFYINKNTIYKKGSSTVDLSAMYVGDRVKLNFKNLGTATVSSIEISETGATIGNLYKGKVVSVNPSSNKLTIKDHQPFVNWSFGTKPTDDLTTMTFNSKVPVYVGNKKIDKMQLKNYVGSDIYYVTLKQFSKEVIEKMVILENNERTYFEQMTSIDTKYQFLTLKTAGRMYFHNGSILVRNGRLVEPTGLIAYGTAHVVTDGGVRDNFAQVVQLTSNSFTSSSLASHELYYGKLSYVDGYSVELDDLVKLSNNYWQYANNDTFSISNDTKAVVNDTSSTISIKPNVELVTYEDYYGYFYVKDGHVQAIHLLERTQPMATQIVTGKLSKVDATFPATIDVQSVSQWEGGSWLESGAILNMDMDQATIIKAGKVIQPSDIKKSDRVFIISDSNINSHIIFVD
ncbi:MAG: hypothetical protein RR595_04085 [Lysinibacillus sp.]